MRFDKSELILTGIIVGIFSLFFVDTVKMINGEHYIDALEGLILRLRGTSPDPAIQSTFLTFCVFLGLVLFSPWFISTSEKAKFFKIETNNGGFFKRLFSSKIVVDRKKIIEIKENGVFLYLWNCGKDNCDGDFEWWEWHGINLVKRWWKRTMGSYIVKLSEPKADDVVLHLGCGSSPLINEFQCQNIGIDKNKDKITFLEKKTNASLYVGDIAEIEFPSANVIICSEALEYLNKEQGEKVFEKISRSLEENGRVVVTIPNSNNGVGGTIEKIIHRKEREKNSVNGFYPLNKTHIEKMAKNNGLKIIREKHLLDLDCAFLLVRCEQHRPKILNEGEFID